jgi:hypothetical protein
MIMLNITDQRRRQKTLPCGNVASSDEFPWGDHAALRTEDPGILWSLGTDTCEADGREDPGDSAMRANSVRSTATTSTNGSSGLEGPVTSILLNRLSVVGRVRLPPKSQLTSGCNGRR